VVRIWPTLENPTKSLLNPSMHMGEGGYITRGCELLLTLLCYFYSSQKVDISISFTNCNYKYYLCFTTSSAIIRTETTVQFLMFVLKPLKFLDYTLIVGVTMPALKRGWWCTVPIWCRVSAFKFVSALDFLPTDDEICVFVFVRIIYTRPVRTILRETGLAATGVLQELYTENS